MVLLGKVDSMLERIDMLVLVKVSLTLERIERSTKSAWF